MDVSANKANLASVGQAAGASVLAAMETAIGNRAKERRESADNLPPLDWSRVATLREAIQQMPERDVGEMAETLWRMDERMKAIERRQEEILRAVETQKAESEKRFVTADQFAPVQRIVYGLVTAIGLAIVGSLMALILKGKP